MLLCSFRFEIFDVSNQKCSLFCSRRDCLNDKFLGTSSINFLAIVSCKDFRTRSDFTQQTTRPCHDRPVQSTYKSTTCSDFHNDGTYATLRSRTAVTATANVLLTIRKGGSACLILERGHMHALITKFRGTVTVSCTQPI